MENWRKGKPKGTRLMLWATCHPERPHAAKGLCRPCYNKQWSKDHPDKCRQYWRNSYSKHNVRERAKQSRYKKQRQIWLTEYKKTLVCSRCPENFWACLDFHHRDPATKEFTIRDGASYSQERVLAEITKCDVLCANCHRKEHHS